MSEPTALSQGGRPPLDPPRRADDTRARAPEPDAPPRTGDAEIDGALQELVDLPELPLETHHERLSRVHEVLHGALARGDEPGPSQA